jgi:predicted nucleic acid-binding protein
MTVWAFSPTEVTSALRRREREGGLDRAGFESADRKLRQLASGWLEVQEILEVRAHAERFLGDYALRAADALQLGAAFVYADGTPKNRPFVVFDGALRDAARDLGFKVVSPA